MSWFHPSGSLRTSEADVVVTPEMAGWAYSGMQVFTLSPGSVVTVKLTGEEGVIVPLSARDVRVTVDGEEFALAGRDGVFAAVSDWLYVPVGSTVTMAGAAGDIALCTARASEVHPVAHIAAAEVPVEVRGAGRATRQVTNIATPGSFTGAHRINVCEVITPGGNWSSWPPHRHDGIGDCTVTNEEIYYFRIGRENGPHGDAAGQGLFHVYTVDGSVDETVTLHDGDVYLVPEGYHGPSVAPPEYPMYFLNVLAGPGEDRTMAFCDDPEHHWIRESWNEQAPDPRLPWTTAAGRREVR
jgi:5-deoxy-glucuronate isomerase